MIPEHKIPDRSTWQKIRDGAGGKKGMAKVNVGGMLDEFAKAYATAKSKSDMGPLLKTIEKLDKTLGEYLKSLNSTTDSALINAVKLRLQKPSADFVKALETEAEKQFQAINERGKKFSQLILNRCNLTINGAKQIEERALEKINALMSLVADINKNGLKKEEAAAAVKKSQEATDLSPVLRKAHVGLEKEMLNLATEARNDNEHKRVLEQLNGDVAKAGVAMKSAYEQIRMLEARAKELLITVKTSLSKG